MTYGQLENGKRITWADYEKEVAHRLRNMFINRGAKQLKLLKKLYNKGYSISDACSFMILNS